MTGEIQIFDLETAAQFARDEFADSDREELADAIREIENCRTVEIDDAGDVWIADPQTGHWLDRDRLIALHKAIMAKVVREKLAA